jgi:hypothetical protein
LVLYLGWLTPAPGDSGYAAEGTQQVYQKCAIIERVWITFAAVLEPFRWAAFDELAIRLLGLYIFVSFLFPERRLA